MNSEDGSKGEDKSMQMPPGVFDLLHGGTNARIARILSLSSVLPTPPNIPWQAYREHWFTTASITNLGTVLASCTTLNAKYVADLSSLKAIAAELADPSKYRYQLKAKGVLSQNDWITGVPSYGTPSYYFVQQQPPIPNRAMRPMFQISTADPKVLTFTTWFTLDNTVTSYFSGLPIGTSLPLAATSLGSIPQNGWYYRAP